MTFRSQPPDRPADHLARPVDRRAVVRGAEEAGLVGAGGEVDAARQALVEEAREELEIAYQGGELEVGFNIGYLMDVLRNVHADDMQLAFGDANRSTLFTIPNNPNFKYIVMPMRI